MGVRGGVATLRGAGQPLEVAEHAEPYWTGVGVLQAQDIPESNFPLTFCKAKTEKTLPSCLKRAPYDFNNNDGAKTSAEYPVQRSSASSLTYLSADFRAACPSSLERRTAAMAASMGASETSL